jgi:hypothetical protein
MPFYYIQQEEDFLYEMNAGYDSIRERFAGEDLSQDAADEYEWLALEAAEEAAAKGWHDAHVTSYRVHLAAVRIAAGDAGFDDIPF